MANPIGSSAVTFGEIALRLAPAGVGRVER